MNKSNGLMIIIAAIAAMFIVHSNTQYVSEDSILTFLSISPTLIGILLASILTSLAIILAIIGSSEMIRIKELEGEENKKYFREILDDLKQNVYFILAAFTVASLLSIFNIKNSFFIIEIGNVFSFETYKSLFVIVVILFTISCIATYDIINGLFTIFEFKYDLANQTLNKSKESK